MPTKEIYSSEANWTDLPLHRILYEWFVRNMKIPTEISTFVAYIGLILIIWYTIVWITRFIITIIWPLFLIASAIFYEPDEIVDMISKSLSIVGDTLVMILAKSLEFVLSFIDYVIS